MGMEAASSFEDSLGNSDKPGPLVLRAEDLLQERGTGTCIVVTIAPQKYRNPQQHALEHSVAHGSLSNDISELRHCGFEL